MANFKVIPSSTATLTNPAITNPTITGGTATSLTALSTTAGSTTLLGGAAASASSTLAILASATVASDAAAVWNGVSVQASTLTLTGTTRCTSVLALAALAAPTITAASAVTVDLGATLYVAGPPVAAGSVTLTLPLSIHSPAGDSYINNLRANSLSLRPSAGGASAGTIQASGGYVYFDTVNGTIFRGTGAAEAMRFLPTLNLCIGATATGTNAVKCLALGNAATAPSDSADLAHLYAADHNGVAGSAALALYQEAATVTCGDQTVDRAVLATVNGVPLWIMARSAAPV